MAWGGVCRVDGAGKAWAAGDGHGAGLEGAVVWASEEGSPAEERLGGHRGRGEGSSWSREDLWWSPAHLSSLQGVVGRSLSRSLRASQELWEEV